MATHHQLGSKVIATSALNSKETLNSTTPFSTLPPSHPHSNMSGAQKLINLLDFLPKLQFQLPPLGTLKVTLMRDSIRLLLQLYNFVL